MAKFYFFRYLLVSLLITLIFSTYSQAQQKIKSRRTNASGTKEIKYKPWSIPPNVTLVNESGKQVQFFDDIVKNKTVVINFLFSSCEYRCPMQGQKFADLSSALGKRLGKEVFLVSISIDPTYDTPERLNTFSQNYGRQEGWTLLTGTEAEVNKLLRSLIGRNASGKSDHNAVILVGQGNEKDWSALTSLYGLAPTADILDLIEKVKTAAKTQ